jgi:hypothetical protein
MNCYSIVKQTATHADTLAAIGAADMFRHLEPRIVELEDRFEIRFPRGLKSSDVDAVDPGFSYLLRPRKSPPNLPPERTIEIPPAGRGVDGDPDRMYRILWRMKAYSGPNKIVMQFARLSRAEWSRRILLCRRRAKICAILGVGPTFQSPVGHGICAAEAEWNRPSR